MRQPTSAEWARINALFDRLVDQPERSWSDSIATADADEYVSRCVLAMLAANRDTGMLDAPHGIEAGIGESAANPEGGYRSLPDGSRVGAFRIVRLIGRGGMGEVYLAERSEGFAQQVALKLLRPEAADRMALFEAERQVLAQLEHPGIARLIDGGIAPDRRAYMAMEFVDGEPITLWCAKHEATLDQRLRLMIEVCDAVSYAHARLIVHRDLKPGNILVDAEGRPRLLDFGIAKLIGDVAPEQTLTQAILTPDYGAPEQFRREPVTVAADVYALGGILYELLVGQGAWKRDGASGPAQIMRMIFDEPEAPSKVASRLAKPPFPARRLEGDLDAIVMKAMRYDAAERYQSVAQMAADIRRHLNFEPVEARQGALGYQLRRFVRRHRAAALAAGVALFALLAGAGGIAWQAQRAATERDIAQTQAKRAQAVNQAVVLMFRNAQEFGQGESETAKGLLNDSADRLLASFGNKSPDTAPVVLALSELYIELADMTGAETLLKTALDKGVGQGDPAARARLQNNLAAVEGAVGKFDEANALLDQSEAVWRKDPLQYRRERLEAISARAQVLRQQGKREEAIKLLTDSLPDARAEYAADPRTMLILYNNIAVHLIESDRLDEAGKVLTDAEALTRQSRNGSSPAALTLLQLRGGWFNRKGDLDSALTYYRKAADQRSATYGPSASLAVDLLQVGLIEQQKGLYKESVAALGETQRLASQFMGEAGPVTAMASVGLAAAYGNLDDPARGRAALAAADPVFKAIGTQNAIYGNYLMARSQLEFLEKDYRAAAKDMEAADALRIAIGGSGAPLKRPIEAMREKLAALGKR